MVARSIGWTGHLMRWGGQARGHRLWAVTADSVADLRECAADSADRNMKSGLERRLAGPKFGHLQGCHLFRRSSSSGWTETHEAVFP